MALVNRMMTNAGIGFATKLKTDVCIVGAGPVGMVLKLMLDKFKINSLILEKQQEMQQHPKAHYLSFRTCEILSDLGLGKNLASQLDSLDRWNSYAYT
jgi:2-polyprenyl-6-methoxyphenol hydroxylase-like FAD-dependent oxidoreductase